MKIHNISKLYLFKNIQQTKDNQTINGCTQNRQMYEYPRNYVPYFNGRINRSPENFHAQKCNQDYIPETVRRYLEEDSLNRRKMEPLELQRTAFKNLEYAKTIADVGHLFPDEPSFQKLKEIEDTSSKKTYLNILKSKGATGNTVLKSGEHLTIYILKKMYFEGKDLYEINEDFSHDVNDEYKAESYFDYSALHQLGIAFPHTGYWASLKATREDYYEYIQQHLSDEQRAAKSQRMINMWLSLSPEEKMERIEKLRNTKNPEMRILFKYLSPLMVFATTEINLSDKLSEFWQKELGTDLPEEDFISDFTGFEKKYEYVLGKFWSENPDLKNQFSQAIINSIKTFQTAENAGEQAIKILCKTADLIKQINQQKGNLKHIEKDLSERKNKLDMLDDTLKKQQCDLDSQEEKLKSEKEAYESWKAEIEEQAEKTSISTDKLIEKEKELKKREITFREKEIIYNRRMKNIEEKEQTLKAKELELINKELKLTETENKLKHAENTIQVPNKTKNVENKKAEPEQSENNIQNSTKLNDETAEMITDKSETENVDLIREKSNIKPDNTVTVSDIEKKEYVTSMSRDALSEFLAFCPQIYTTQLIDFVINHEKFNTSLIDKMYAENCGKKKDKRAREIEDKLWTIINDFELKNKRLSIALKTVLIEQASLSLCHNGITPEAQAKTILPLINKRNIICSIYDLKLGNKLFERKEQIEYDFENFMRELSSEEKDCMYSECQNIIKDIIKNQKYCTNNDKNKKSQLLRNIKELDKISMDKGKADEFKKFIEDYEPMYTAAVRTKNHTYIMLTMETIIANYVEFLQENKDKAKIKSKK